MPRSLHTLTLTESFRAILRAQYAERPALAEEIDSYHWFHYSKSRVQAATEPPTAQTEVQAATAALEALKSGVVHNSIRLRGTLDVSKSLSDIDASDARVGELDVFADTLEIRHPKGARKYHQVHCYETDLPLGRPERPRIRPASRAAVQKFFQQYEKDGGKRTQTAFIAAAQAAGLNASRGILRTIFHEQASPRVGRPRNPPKKLAGK